MFPDRGIDPNGPLSSVSRSQSDALSVVSASRKPEIDQEAEESRDLLVRAHEDFQRCVSWESAWRERAREELQFVDALEHWDGAMKEERKGRPCLTFDRIGPSVDQVVNDARQNPPEPKVSPIGSAADKETAEVIQGMLRNIDQDSSAIIAYLTAYEHAVKIGRGWWRIRFEYENDSGDLDASSFQQKIVIDRVRNPFSIYPDPGAEKLEHSDMGFCFVTEDMSVRAYKEMYPDSQVSSFSSFQTIGDQALRSAWFPNGDVRVVEYWWVEKSKHRIVQLENGMVMLASAAPDDAKIVNRRTVEKRTVYGAKLNGVEILERWTWPGKFIPIVPVIGKEVLKDSKISPRGMVRSQMDANLSFDYLMSKQVETIGLSSIVQWMVAEGQIENYEYQWAQANRKALAFLEYKSIVNGQPVPPPTRIFSSPPVEGITQAIQAMDQAGQFASATWQSNLGKQPTDASGKAITAVQRDSDNAHFNYHDNLMRAMRFSSLVELDLMPHVYSEERMVTVLNPDGSNRQVMVNSEIVDKGIKKIFQMKGAARCDVTMGAGASYASRRAEGADKLMQLVPNLPQITQLAPDLVVKALDIPDGDQIADRIRPPQFQADAAGDTPIPPQVQALIQQQGEQIKQMGAALQAIKQTMDAKVLDIESRERIATQNNEAKVLAAALAGKTAIAQQVAEQTHEHIQGDLDRRADLLHTQLTLEQEERIAMMPPPAPQQPGGPQGAPPQAGAPQQ